MKIRVQVLLCEEEPFLIRLMGGEPSELRPLLPLLMVDWA